MPVIKTLKNGVWTKVSSFGELATATSSLNGLMSSADKSKLDKVEVRELLWTNPNPTAIFNAQTISLDLSGYDEVEIESAPVLVAVNQGNGTKIYRCPIGVSTTMDIISYENSVSKLLLGTRNVRVLQDEIGFSDFYYMYAAASGAAINTSNHYLRPYKIYGIKR